MNICSITQLEGISPTLAVKDFFWLSILFVPLTCRLDIRGTWTNSFIMVCRYHVVRALLEYFTRQGREFPSIFTTTRLAFYLVRDGRGREKGT